MDITVSLQLQILFLRVWPIATVTLPPGKLVKIAAMGSQLTHWNRFFRARCVALPFQLKVALTGRREVQELRLKELTNSGSSSNLPCSENSKSHAIHEATCQVINTVYGTQETLSNRPACMLGSCSSEAGFLSCQAILKWAVRG